MAREFSVFSAKFRERADRHLSVLFGCSRAFVQKQIERGFVSINGKPAKPNTYIEARDSVVWDVVEERTEVLPEEMPLEIVWQDPDIVLVNKDAGVNMHPVPGEGGKSGTLVNALLRHVPDLGTIGGVLRPGIVHRLDKDTSGIAVVCKNDRAMAHFYGLFSGRNIKKTYLALVPGRFPEPAFTVKSLLGRDKHDRMRVTWRDPVNPKHSETHFRVLGEYGGFTLVACRPKTGRTHQIRVHLASMGHAIVGDATYGSEAENAAARKRSGLSRHFLHAWALDFEHCGKPRFFSAPLKADLSAALAALPGFDPAVLAPDALKTPGFFVE